MAFDPDSYLAEKELPAQNVGGFNPDAYLASKQAPSNVYSDFPLQSVGKLAQNTASFNQALSSNPVKTLANIPLGLGETVTNIGTGIASSALGGLKGLYKLGTGQGLEAAKQAIESTQQSSTFEPKTESGKYLTSLASAPLEIPSELLGKGLGYAGSLVGGKTEAAGEEIGKAIPAVAGTLLLGKGAIKNAPAIPDLPKLTPEKATLAKKAIDMGIEIPPHALTNNKFVKMTGEFLDSIPLSGSTRDASNIAFQRYIIDRMGGDTTAKALTQPVFADAINASGSKIGEIYSNTKIPIDRKFSNALDDVKQSQGIQTVETEKIINGYIDNIKALGDKNNGIIPGDAMRVFNTDLGARIRSLPIGDLRTQLSDLQETIADAVHRNIKDPDTIQELSDARKQYAIGKLVEPLVAKASLEGIPPQQLLSRMNSTAAGKHRMAMGIAGDIGDAAAIATNFMKSVPSSGTAERGAILHALTSGLGGAGKVLGAGIAANLYNRIGPSISEKIINRSLPEQKRIAEVETDLTSPPANQIKLQKSGDVVSLLELNADFNQYKDVLSANGVHSLSDPRAITLIDMLRAQAKRTAERPQAQAIMIGQLHPNMAGIAGSVAEKQPIILAGTEPGQAIQATPGNLMGRFAAEKVARQALIDKQAMENAGALRGKGLIESDISNKRIASLRQVEEQKRLEEDIRAAQEMTLNSRPTNPDYIPEAGKIDYPSGEEIGTKVLKAISARGGLAMSELKDLLGEKVIKKSGANYGIFTKKGKELGDMAEQLVAEKVLSPSILEGNGGARNLGELIQNELNPPPVDKNYQAYLDNMGEPPVLPGAYKEGKSVTQADIERIQKESAQGKNKLTEMAKRKPRSGGGYY